MLSIILAKKIFSLFIIMLMSMALVRLKIVKASDSKIMSILLLYLFFPCVILESFQIDFTPEIQHGMLLSTGAAVVVQALLLAMGIFLKNTLHLNAVEQCSVIYSNAGNLIIPLVVAVLGLCVAYYLWWFYFAGDDARAERVLTATAETWLDAGCSPARAAATLHVHRQTLYHRLGRIEALTGLDLADGDTRLLLHASLRRARLPGS